jgi:CRP/FNR family transcriptional regulator
MTIRIVRAGAPESIAHVFGVSCGNCHLSSTCLPQAFDTVDIEQIDDIIQHSTLVQKDQHLYREGDNFQSVYAVRSGAMKAYKTTNDGREQVTGFYFPGEILGMDGIANNTHASSAKSLETAALCEFPFSSLAKLSIGLPSVQRQVFQLMSQEIIEDQQLMTSLSKNSVDERVAAFMFSIATRNARRNLSATQFRLPMTRADIGNYLGMTVETVSRVFSRMQKLELMWIHNKEIEILDLAGLQKMANLGN